MAAGQFGAGSDNGNEITAAAGRHAGVPSRDVPDSDDYMVPGGSPVEDCYGYPGSVSYHDKGRSWDEGGQIGAQNPSLGSPGISVPYGGERGDSAFDIKNPPVAPGTAATEIYGS